MEQEMDKGYNRADEMFKDIARRILEEGCMDINPRPRYADGTPAHTLSINHVMQSYDLSKGELPLITLRPIAIKSSIGELLWIYQDQSNSLDVLRDKYNVTWWDEWDIGDRTIGACYGETVRRHNLMNNLLNDIQNNPDGRRHIINMWQEDDFKDKHGLKPCAYQTVWNVRHGKDGKDYLDMCLFQRSSDYATAGIINQMQYVIFQMLVARHCGYEAGRFTWFVANIQIYDRHIEPIKEMLNRKSVECSPRIEINPDKKNFYDITIDDVKITGYPREIIKEQNPQLKFDIGI
jgi:thymidylate synthase